MKWGANKVPVLAEFERVYHLKDGTQVTYTYRDAVVPEIPYMVGVHALLEQKRAGGAHRGAVTPRSIKNALIKTSVEI